MLAGIGIGLATQMAFSLWRSHRHSLQLARYDDHYVLRIQQNLTFMHNPHLLALLAKIPEKSVVDRRARQRRLPRPGRAGGAG